MKVLLVPIKPDWSGLVLSTQNLSYNMSYRHGAFIYICL